MTTTNAQALVAAALASALAFASAGAPALAMPAAGSTEPVAVAQSDQISPEQAYECARTHFGIPYEHVAEAYWAMADYSGHTCYEMFIQEGAWVDTATGQSVVGHKCVAYVDAYTGEVFETRVFY